MGATDFVSRFVEAERPGLYCRVIRPGLLQTGDEFTLLPYAGDTISTLDLYRARYRRLRRAEIVQFLAAPIDIRTRRDLQRDLAGRDPALED
jgi:MOSC domain-containing protein YiiM